MKHDEWEILYYTNNCGSFCVCAIVRQIFQTMFSCLVDEYKRVCYVFHFGKFLIFGVVV